ncbi:MAG: complex I NDUFA9 subunit family protein [Rubrivivax sp.]|nr:complex I NDUFA9 subunit family protein [Rubrivivax sp.]
MTAPKRLLVLGGTGFVGRALCEHLVRRSGGNGMLRVPTRRLSHGQRLQTLPTVDLVSADVHDDAALGRLLDGCDAVINLVAILHGSADEFERVHVTLPRRLAAACQAAGVRRLLHVSALGVGPGAPSNYLRSKTEGEAVLQAAGLDLTLLRPSVIFGAEDRFLNLFADMQALVPMVPLAGASARFQPVWVEDVAAALAAALDQPDSIGKTYEAVGPEVYTLAELVRLAGRWAGHERLVLPLPPAIGRLQALAMSMAPGETLMSPDNLDSMKVPSVASGQLPGLEALGVEPAALASVGPQYLGPHPGRSRFDLFRAHARRG